MLSPKCTDPFLGNANNHLSPYNNYPPVAPWEESFHEEDTLQCKCYLKTPETPRVMLRHPRQLRLTLTSSANADLAPSKIKMPFNTPVTGMVFFQEQEDILKPMLQFRCSFFLVFFPPRSFSFTSFQQRFMFRPLVLACFRDF